MSEESKWEKERVEREAQEQADREENQRRYAEASAHNAEVRGHDLRRTESMEQNTALYKREVSAMERIATVMESLLRLMA